MCPAHGDDVRTINGVKSCRECARVRARVKALHDRNRKSPRHRREMLLRIPNAPLRERYEHLIASGAMTASEIAAGAGYVMNRKSGESSTDTQRLRRQLGVIEQMGRGGGYRADSVSYEVAELLCRAMGIEYTAEVGV